MRELQTETRARGCSHLQWEQPQRLWLPVGARGGSCPPVALDVPSQKLATARRRLISVISGLYPEIGSTAPSTPRGRDPRRDLQAVAYPPRTSHGCRIFAHWAKFVRGPNFYLSRKYIISHVSPGPPQWPSSLANQFNTTVWDEKQHESSIHTNPTVFISCVCLFLNSKCGLLIRRESSQRNWRNQCVV